MNGEPDENEKRMRSCLKISGSPLDASSGGVALPDPDSAAPRLIAGGCSNAEVAAEIGISPHTARRHAGRLSVKLRVRSRAEVGQRLHSSARPEAKDR